jgi:hypothetical protein
MDQSKQGLREMFYSAIVNGHLKITESPCIDIARF